MNRISSRAGVVAIALLTVVTASIAVVVAVNSGGGPADASSPIAGQTISVSGVGTVQGVPDTLDASLDVNAHGASVQEAIDEVGARKSRVERAIIAKGVPSRDIQTTNLSLNPSYDDHGQIDGYDADESLSVSISPLAHVGSVLATAATAAGNSVSIDDVSLDIDHDAALIDVARSKAFQEAKAAATQDAQLAGTKLGPVVSVKETQTDSTSTPPPFYGDALAATPNAKALSISPGRQPVSVTLAVVWSLN
jgi:uncharacterized protein YggE